MNEETAIAAPAPIVYVTDLPFEIWDAADLFDLAFLLRSANHDLRAVCFTSAEDDGGDRVMDAIVSHARPDAHFQTAFECDAARLATVLDAQRTPVNLVVAAGYFEVAELLEKYKETVRAKVARIFLIGGNVNDYESETLRLPIDPRLRERNPERFTKFGDYRANKFSEVKTGWGQILTSGEAVIWLPRDICLWRYAAAGVLEDGGALCDFLLRELFYCNLKMSSTQRGNFTDRYQAWEEPVLLSALPAFLLAFQPDTAAWMRLFRALPARVETDEDGDVTTFATRTDAPNIYAVIAIDGQACGKLLTARLRDRPLL